MFSRLSLLKKFFKTTDKEVNVASATYSTVNKKTGATSDYNMTFTRVDTKSVRFPKLWVSQYWCEITTMDNETSTVDGHYHVKIPIEDVITPHYLIIQKYLDIVGGNTSVNISGGVMWWKFNDEVHSTLVDGDGVDGYNFTKTNATDDGSDNVKEMFGTTCTYDLDRWDNYNKSVVDLGKKLSSEWGDHSTQDDN